MPAPDVQVGSVTNESSPFFGRHTTADACEFWSRSRATKPRVASTNTWWRSTRSREVTVVTHTVVGPPTASAPPSNERSSTESTGADAATDAPPSPRESDRRATDAARAAETAGDVSTEEVADVSPLTEMRLFELSRATD